MFEQLQCLLKYNDIVFQQFYDELLSKPVFAKHFESEEQTRALIIKQKQNFKSSLSDSKEELFNRYCKIGIIHYNHNIPYEVFLSATRVLRDIFDGIINDEIRDSQVLLSNTVYFDFIAEAMAKGYLDRYLQTEITDINKIMSLIRVSTFGEEKELLVFHYKWMLNLLTAIEKENYHALDELLKTQGSGKNTLYGYIERHLDDLGMSFSMEEIEIIRFRILSNTENIFFYLGRKAYSDALSLIIHILEIYKLTLVLDNVVSNIIVKKAEAVITEKVKLAETDPLTNIMNRRKFDELLEGLLCRSQRKAIPLTIAIFDIDNFKQVNDNFGHQTGDDVLIELTGLIGRFIRKNDYLLRYGGEEFVIISNESDLAGSVKMAEKIRSSIEQHRFTKAGRITLSIGLAEAKENDNSSSLFKRADNKLYEAKLNGKNRVCY